LPRLLVRRRQQDFAVQRLDRPAGGEALRQVVEQLGVRRRLAELAEVARGADEALAEVVLPDAVDHHARRQRVVGAGDGLRQLQPAAALREWPGVGAQDREELARRLLGQRGGVAAQVDAQRDRLAFLQRVDDGEL